MNWGSKNDSKLACKEGWEVFEAEGSMCNRQGNWPYQVQALTEEAILDDDTDAHLLIVEGVKKGRSHHLRALRFLRQHSKPELALIYETARKSGIGWEACIPADDEALDALEIEIFGEVLTR